MRPQKKRMYGNRTSAISEAVQAISTTSIRITRDRNETLRVPNNQISRDFYHGRSRKENRYTRTPENADSYTVVGRKCYLSCILVLSNLIFYHVFLNLIFSLFPTTTASLPKLAVAVWSCLVSCQQKVLSESV